MNKLNRHHILAAVFSILTFHNFALADQDGTFNYDSENQKKPQEVNKASNASFDKRLPPVLPGEVLNDGHSKTKVWSTAGSVSSGDVPNAPSAPVVGSGNGQTIIEGVVVDDRGHRGQR